MHFRFTFFLLLCVLSIQVRVTASWALANVCEALRYRVNDTSFGGINAEVIIRRCYNFWILFFLSSP